MLAKEGDKVRLVRFGDPNMTIKKSDPKRRASFRARHKCGEKKSKLTAGYWRPVRTGESGTAPGGACDQREAGFPAGAVPIHGTGVFSNRAYKPDEVVGRAISSLVDEGRGGIGRTLLGIYVNHREVPNTRLEKSQDSDRYFLRAIRAIEPDAEILVAIGTRRRLLRSRTRSTL